MDTKAAFAMGQANRGKESMVFDWDEAARRIKASGCEYASAGLSGDWEYTGDCILQDGEPTSKGDTYTYLASTWATPMLRIDDEDAECYRMQSEVPDWDEDTLWPESALKILRGEIDEK